MNANIADTMMRYGVGLNPWFFERTGERSKFPPHNITEIYDGLSNKDAVRYRLTLAVAGYSRDDLRITLQGELLTIRGTKSDDLVRLSNPNSKGTTEISEITEHGYRVLHRGIALREFTSEFLIGQDVRIDTVTLKDGLLDIDLVRKVPDSERLKEIPIS